VTTVSRWEIDPRSWHFRVYSYWKRELSRKPPKTINLCHYMRAILIYTPAYWLGYGIAIALAVVLGGAFLLVTAPIWVPLYFIGRGRGWGTRLEAWADRQQDKFMIFILGVVGLCVVAVIVNASLDKWWYGLVIIGGIVGGVALIFGIGITAAEISDRRKRQRWLREEGIVPSKEARPPSLTWAWIKAKKQKVCPIIEVRSDQTDASS
jgi:hypothetical protein